MISEFIDTFIARGVAFFAYFMAAAPETAFEQCAKYSISRFTEFERKVCLTTSLVV
jgi:hypothetical protein